MKATTPTPGYPNQPRKKTDMIELDRDFLATAVTSLEFIELMYYQSGEDYESLREIYPEAAMTDAMDSISRLEETVDRDRDILHALWVENFLERINYRIATTWPMDDEDWLDLMEIVDWVFYDTERFREIFLSTMARMLGLPADDIFEKALIDSTIASFEDQPWIECLEALMNDKIVIVE